MQSPKPNPWKKKLWLLAEFLISNLIGFLINPNLELGVSLCFLLWNWLKDDETQPDKTKQQQSLTRFIILCAIALTLSLSLTPPVPNCDKLQQEKTSFDSLVHS